MDNKQNGALLDSLIKHAGRRLLIEMGESSPTKEEAAQAVGPVDDLDIRMDKLIKRYGRRQRWHKISRVAAQAAAFILVIIAVSGVAIARSEALRKQVYDVVVDERVGTIGLMAAQPEDVPAALLQDGAIPEGFVLADAHTAANRVLNVYENTQGEHIRIERKQLPLETNSKDDLAASEIITLGDTQIFVYSLGDQTILAAEHNGMVLECSGNVSQEVLLDIMICMLK